MEFASPLSLASSYWEWGGGMIYISYNMKWEVQRGVVCRESACTHIVPLIHIALMCVAGITENGGNNGTGGTAPTGGTGL